MSFGDQTIDGECLIDFLKRFGKTTVYIGKKVANNPFRASKASAVEATKLLNRSLAETQLFTYLKKLLPRDGWNVV